MLRERLDQRLRREVEKLQERLLGRPKTEAEAGDDPQPEKSPSPVQGIEEQIDRLRERLFR